MCFDLSERVIQMVQRKIRLSVDEVKDFVDAACKCDFDIDIAYNRYIVDAKSILGVFGLDMSKVLTVTYNGYNTEFEHYLNHLAIAC